MTKLSRRQLPKEDWEEFFDQICNALTLFETKQEIREFLSDLWTYTEKKMFSKRLQVARCLLNGLTYDAISTRFKVTETMIASVSDNLNAYGYGFNNAHKKLDEFEGKRQKRREYAIKKIENPFRIRSRSNLSETIKANMESVARGFHKNKRIKSAKI